MSDLSSLIHFCRNSAILSRWASQPATSAATTTAKAGRYAVRDGAEAARGSMWGGWPNASTSEKVIVARA